MVSSVPNETGRTETELTETGRTETELTETGRTEVELNPVRSPLIPGTLWQRIQDQTQQGLACGALQSIPTTSEMVEDGGIPFIVRRVENLIRKEQATQMRQRMAQTEGKVFNPFLPYDVDLFVSDLSATHVAVLNKFNVVDHHLLMITRGFEDQDSVLTVADFEAMGIVLRELGGLVFYNGGKLAGASQRHKHLQWVPLPLAQSLEQGSKAGGLKLPMEQAILAGVGQAGEGGMGRSEGLPFQHGIVALTWEGELAEVAQRYCDAYRRVLAQLRLMSQAIPHASENGSLDLSYDATVETECPQAYNLLATRDWLLIVPRGSEELAGISVNSLGFAGALLVKTAEQFEQIRQMGPLNLLAHVGVHWNH